MIIGNLQLKTLPKPIEMGVIIFGVISSQNNSRVISLFFIFFLRFLNSCRQQYVQGVTKVPAPSDFEIHDMRGNRFLFIQ
jgi:hypothetical protein